MKRNNITKLPTDFTVVKSVLTLGLMISQIAFANAKSSGDSSTKEHLKGKGVLDKASIESENNLNFNKIKVLSMYNLSPGLKGQVFFGINLNDLLNVYYFPNDKALMSDLYDKALKREGDYTSLMGYQNPFSQFIDNEISGDFIDNSKKWKEFPKNINKSIINSIYQFNLTRKIFSDLPSGLGIKSTLQINPQLNPDGCEVCSKSDYKSIPENGISLDVICIVSSVKADGIELYEYNDKNPLKYTTGVKARITSQTEKIDIESPVINSSIVEEIRTKYCHDQETKEVSVRLYCALEPSTNIDKAKLLSSFNKEYIGLWNSGFNLKNFKNLESNESMAKDVNPRVPLASIKSRERVHEYPILGISGYHETVAYKFPKFEKTIIYAQTESELAEMVRRSYITGYEALLIEKPEDHSLSNRWHFW